MNIKKLTIALATAAAAISCSETDYMTFDSADSGVYFTKDTLTYSFSVTPIEIKTYTYHVPFRIMGPTSKEQRKVSFIIDPALTVSLPPYHTACGITDMMAHILERYFSPTADVEVTDRLAEGLLMAIIDEAPKVMASPDNYQARANITWASTMAHNGILGCGRVEDWTSHAMEHEISALYDVAHGAGLAVVFPAWLTFMVDHKPAKVAQLGRRIFAIDIADDRLAAIETVARLKAFFKVVLGMPSTFAELGIAEPDIDAMVRGLHKVKGEMVGGYYKLNSSDTRSIYRMML